MPFSTLDSYSKRVQDLPDQPSENMTSSEIKAWFDSSPEEIRQAFNAAVNILLSQSQGDSGAKNIKATPIIGVTGQDIQTLLENMLLADHKGTWNGLTPQMIGAPEMNSARISALEFALTSNIDAGMFGDTTNEVPIDGGIF